MAIRFANNFNKPLAAGCTSIDLTISLSGANAIALQTAIGGALGADYLFATLVDASNNIEIIKITAINTGTGALTVQRGQDLTTARAWLSGDILSVRPNRQALLDALQVNVGKANSGVNNDITSLTGLTTPLSIAQGGTGGNSEASALTALGAVLNAVDAKAEAYTVIAADRGKLIDATTGTWTLTLTAAATLGAGFVIGVRNSGTGVVTIDPNASEQIDGATTIALAAGESYLIVCDGVGWKTVGRAKLPVAFLIPTTTQYLASGSWTPDPTRYYSIQVHGGGGAGGHGGSPCTGSNGQAGASVTGRYAAGVLSGSYTITVGAGGTARNGTSGNGGGQTSFVGMTSRGGNGGASTNGEPCVTGVVGLAGAGTSLAGPTNYSGDAHVQSSKTVTTVIGTATSYGLGGNGGTSGNGTNGTAGGAIISEFEVV